MVREQGTGKGEKKLLVGSTDFGLYQSNIPRLAAGLPRVSRETVASRHGQTCGKPLLILKPPDPTKGYRKSSTVIHPAFTTQNKYKSAVADAKKVEKSRLEGFSGSIIR